MNSISNLSSAGYMQLPDGSLQRKDHLSPRKGFKKGETVGEKLLQVETEPARFPFTTISLGELLRQEVDGNMDLVEGLIPESGCTILAGEPGTMKTWSSLDLAISVASGKSFLGKFPVQKGTVLFVDEESGKKRLQLRLKKLLNGQQPDELPLSFSVMNSVNLRSNTCIIELKRTIEELKPKLIIFDSLIRVHTGDENSAEEMAKVFATISEIRKQYGSAVCFCHHLRKHPSGRAFVEEGLDQRVRGSSDITAYADSVIGLEVRDGKRIFRHLKNRDGDLYPPSELILTETEEEGIKILLGDAVDEEASKRTKAETIILAILNSGQKTRPELLASIKGEGIGERIAAEALSSLKKSGRVVKTGTKRVGNSNVAVYALKSEEAGGEQLSLPPGF